MSLPEVLSFAAAYFSLIVAVAVLFRDRHSIHHRIFAAGMLLFAVEEMLRGFRYGAVLPGEVLVWQERMLAVSALVPGAWLVFSFSYARANSGSFHSRWKWALAALVVVPSSFLAIFRSSLFTGSARLDAAGWVLPLGWSGKAFQYYILIVSVLIVFNMERILRSSIGRTRWQMKFLALGIAGLFALRIYICSQTILFSNLDTRFGTTRALALLAANLLFAFSFSRGSSLEVEVYFSRATIQNSLTIILAGIYLLSVGALAQLTRSYLPVESLSVNAFIVFLALMGLAVLLLSNHVRRQIRQFVTRHFNRPMYDYRSVWMDLTRRTTSLMDVRELSGAICRMVSESLEILSVNVWLIDETRQHLSLTGSTSLSHGKSREIERAGKSAPEFIRYLQRHRDPIDLEETTFDWPTEIMQAGADFFGEYRMRYAVGLYAGGELVGVMTLNDDRVGSVKLSAEDFILLETLAAQLAASLLNLKLSERLRRAGEVEAFHSVSTFFVHDMKNLASRLSLTMENLPKHFDDPQFRADALRVISGSVASIDDLCSRLTMLKQNIELRVAESDLGQLVNTTLDEFKSSVRGVLERDLHPMPKALMDQQQIHKVLTNLVMNANEAVYAANGNGVIRVATIHEGESVGFAVRDNGCGMSEEFIENSLFKPFQTTKKKGLGIGLFHCKLIVEAHHGSIEVNSAEGQGTEFRVLLPVA
jgi:putative PEP-CTERM system histidine kinase